MEALKSWAMVVTGTVILGSVCEVLMPDGNLKKFVRVTLGILLVFSIAKPLVTISDRDFMIGEIKQSRIMASDYTRMLDDENKFQIIKSYKKNLNEKIEKAIREKDADAVVEVKTDVETENEKDFGEIKSVTVVVTGGADGDFSGSVYSALDEFGVRSKDVDIKYIRQRGG